jgi:hypothetical protein
MKLTTIKTELTEFDEQVRIIRSNLGNKRMLAILIDEDGNVEVVVPGEYPIINLFGALELAKYAIGD